MAGKAKVPCSKCGRLCNTSQIKRHESSCKGKQEHISIIELDGKKYCPLCRGDITNQDVPNHIRWCKENPKAAEYHQAAAERFLKRDPLDYIDIGEKIKKAHLEGKYDEAKAKQRKNPYWQGKQRSPETKEKLSNTCRNLKYRRLVKSCRLYTCKNGQQVLLDSSWEEAVARRLDYLDITWIRPGPIEYLLEGKYHNYFPDFYLKEFDLYLDPKNPEAIRAQKKKLDVITKLLPNLIIIKTLKECNLFDPRSLYQPSKLEP